MFELGKTPNVDKKSFVLVVNEFWIVLKFFCIIGWDWVGLVLCSVCKKGKC